LTGKELEEEICRHVEDEAGRSYVRAHAQRFHETIALIPTTRPLEVLDLGTLLPLTVVLNRITPHQYTLTAPAGPSPRKEVVAGGRTFSLYCFDVERDVFPFPDGSFDLVLCSEVIEHLGLDPMFMLAEINRVLRPGGCLLLTTPNVVSTRNTLKAILGYSPSFYSSFTLTPDRHNREYAPAEIRMMLTASGFAVEKFLTRDVYHTDLHFPQKEFLQQAAVGALLRLLRTSPWRGEAIFTLAGKTGPVVNRYPDWLYDIPH
jgi:SAM-dependent methyltransferase